MDPGAPPRTSLERTATDLGVLDDPVKRRIVGLLTERYRQPSSLARELGLSLPIVSRHLRGMRNAGLVRSQRTVGDGRLRAYSLIPDQRNRILSWLAKGGGAAADGVVDDGSARPWTGSRQVTTFEVGSHRLAIRSDRIERVVPYTSPATVPLTPDAIEGVADVAGRIVPVLSMRRRLGIEPDDPADRRARLIVVGTVHGPVGLHVDATSGVATVDAGSIELLPRIATRADRPGGADRADATPGSAASGPGPGVIAGIARIDGTLTAIVDVDWLVAPETNLVSRTMER